MAEQYDQQIIALSNPEWGISAKDMRKRNSDSIRVDVYSRGKLQKSHECHSIRAALMKACDIVGEDA